MFERFSRKSLTATAAALLAALGMGGAALAQSGNANQTPSPAPTASQHSAAEAPGHESNAPENSATDTDNIQQGDQNAPDKADGPESAREQADGTEKESATEHESGSEKVNDDGPGGHADEPGNPNADHQAQGQE